MRMRLRLRERPKVEKTKSPKASPKVGKPRIDPPTIVLSFTIHDSPFTLTPSFLLNIFRIPRMNKLPAIAGITRLKTQMLMDVIKMPRWLALKSPTSIILTFPLNPNSANAGVGNTAITKK